jgi:hypothetical protein
MHRVAISTDSAWPNRWAGPLTSIAPTTSPPGNRTGAGELIGLRVVDRITGRDQELE